MTHAMMKSDQTPAATAGAKQNARQVIQVASPVFASVHGVAQAIVIVERTS